MPSLGVRSPCLVRIGLYLKPRHVNSVSCINEGLVLLKLANTVLILINTGPSNVKDFGCLFNMSITLAPFMSCNG